MITPTMLGRYLRRVVDQPLTLHLYTDIVGSSEAGIAEASGGGYAPQTVAPGDWKLADGGITAAEGPVREFRFDGSKRLVVKGAFLTQADGGVLWVQPFKDESGAERPIEVGRRGDIIPVRPIMRLGAVS